MPVKFTRKTDYALRLMQILAQYQGGGLIPVKAMSERTGMTVKFLQAVSRDLSLAGLLIAKAGPNGGLSLSRPPAKISILSVVEAAEGKINLLECLEEPHSCKGFHGCSVMSVLYAAQEALIETLRATSLEMMIRRQVDRFGKVPDGNFQNPTSPCPLLKNSRNLT